MRKRLLYPSTGPFLLLMFTVRMAGAAPTTQTVTLKPGWNAVFLEVDPVSSSCADAFSSLDDLISAWTWNPKVATVEFVGDPDNGILVQLLHLFEC